MKNHSGVQERQDGQSGPPIRQGSLKTQQNLSRVDVSGVASSGMLMSKGPQMDHQRWVRQKMVDRCYGKGCLGGKANCKVNFSLQMLYFSLCWPLVQYLYSICRRINLRYSVNLTWRSRRGGKIVDMRQETVWVMSTHILQTRYFCCRFKIERFFKRWLLCYISYSILFLLVSYYHSSKLTINPGIGIQIYNPSVLKKFKMVLTRLTSRCWQSCVPFGSSRREFIFLSFPASRDHLTPSAIIL